MAKDLWARVDGPDETPGQTFKLEIGKSKSLPSPMEVVGLILTICEDLLVKNTKGITNAEVKALMIEHIQTQDISNVEVLEADEAIEAMGKELEVTAKAIKENMN